MYMFDFLKQLFALLKESDSKIVSAVVAPVHKKKKDESELLARLQLYGLKTFCKMATRVTLSKLRGKMPSKFLLAQEIDYIPHDMATSASLADYVKTQNIDLILSVAYPKIIKPPLLHSAPLGCINYHTGRLPDYRGRMPFFWAMYNKEKSVTLTLHRMVEELDAGAILAEREIPLSSGMSLHDLYLEGNRQGPPLIAKVLDDIGKGNSTEIRVPEITSGKPRTFPSPEAALNFRKTGGQFL